MKSILACLAIISFVLASCKKENTTLTSGRLTFVKDSMEVRRLEYNSNNQVVAVWVDSTGWWQTYNAITPSKTVSFSHSTNYLKATYAPGPGANHYYIEYFFNSFKLPDSVIVTAKVNGGTTDSVLKRVRFFYKPSSALLDSIVSKGYFQLKYVPQYLNGNIVQCTFSSVYPNQFSQVFKYSYNLSPNPYRATDPYLFIYLEPSFMEHYNSWIPAVFSNNAVQSIEAYGVTTNVLQLVNTNNQFVYEDWGFNLPYRRIYVYQ